MVVGGVARLGAGDREDAQSRVRVGDVATLDAGCTELGNGLIAAVRGSHNCGRPPFTRNVQVACSFASEVLATK